MPFSSRTSAKRSVAASRAAFGRVGRAGALLRLRRRSRVRRVYGARKINETEAATVRRILTEFAAGAAPPAGGPPPPARRPPPPPPPPCRPAPIPVGQPARPRALSRYASMRQALRRTRSAPDH